MPEPVVLAEVRRSGVREGAHRGHAVVLSADGQVIRSWGDAAAPILPRSANKPAQAAAMVRAGLPLADELLALAAASHSGEDFHLDGVERILAMAGLGVDALATPPDLPLDEVAREAWLASGRTRTREAMNCSGKHAAMLLTCTIAGWPTQDYLAADHPLQVAARIELEQLAGEQVWATAIDGCGAPLYGLSLVGLARMAQSCVLADEGTPPRRVADAMRAHPTWMGGTRRDSAVFMRAVPGLLVKEGAEGIYVAALPDGTAIAMKLEDGGDRARGGILSVLLQDLDLPAGSDREVLAGLEVVPLLGGGVPVGGIVPTLG